MCRVLFSHFYLPSDLKTFVFIVLTQTQPNPTRPRQTGLGRNNWPLTNKPMMTDSKINSVSLRWEAVIGVVIGVADGVAIGAVAVVAVVVVDVFVGVSIYGAPVIGRVNDDAVVAVIDFGIASVIVHVRVVFVVGDILAVVFVLL